jgi:hypothetical protein
MSLLFRLVFRQSHLQARIAKAFSDQDAQWRRLNALQCIGCGLEPECSSVIFEGDVNSERGPPISVAIKAINTAPLAMDMMGIKRILDIEHVRSL